jgi:hypothetical protein
MSLLYGTNAPEGDGLVLEVHLDITQLTPEFELWLEDHGFESDPFLVFFPPQYNHHRTGRTRIAQARLKSFLPEVVALVEEVIVQARKHGVALYAETELVRQTNHFPESASEVPPNALDGIVIRPSSGADAAEADVHVEFLEGTVSNEVKKYLSDKGFYWVSTPRSARFPSEEIATLQTATFDMAKQIYDRLVSNRLSACTGIHLEQKLSMARSEPGLPMPQVMKITQATK